MTFRLHDNHARHLGRQPTITADAEPDSQETADQMSVFLEQL